MGFPRSKRKFLVDIMGEERVRRIEAGLAAKSEELEAMGIDFKTLDDLVDRVGKLAVGTADRKGLLSSEETDWHPRRQEPAPTEPIKSKETAPPSPVAPYLGMLTGQEEGG